MKLPLNIFFSEYSIMISWKFLLKGCKNPIIMEKIAKIRCSNWSFSTENGRKSKFLWMKHPLNIFFMNIATWYCQISTHKVAKILLSLDKNSLYQISAKIRCWKWSFSTENGRKSKILRMKHPSKIFLHNIASWYRQISTHKVAKIQLLRTKIHYTQF